MSEETRKPEVIIEMSVYRKINHWVQKSPVEVSGLGRVILQDGVYRVVSAILLKQKNSSTETDLEPADVAKAMYETRDEPGTLNFWWHSHVDMGVFWSQTDLDTMGMIGQNGWVLSTVFNKRQQRRSALFVGSQAPHIGVGRPIKSIYEDDLDTRVLTHSTDEEKALWDKEFDEKCVEEVESYHTQEDLIGWTPPEPPADIEVQKKKAGDEDEESDDTEGAESGGNTSTVPTFNDGAWDKETTEQFVEDLCQDMEQEEDPKAARSSLGQIVQLLAKTEFLTEYEKHKYKRDAIERYNIAQKGVFNGYN